MRQAQLSPTMKKAFPPEPKTDEEKERYLQPVTFEELKRLSSYLKTLSIDDLNEFNFDSEYRYIWDRLIVNFVNMLGIAFLPNLKLPTPFALAGGMMIAFQGLYKEDWPVGLRQFIMFAGDEELRIVANLSEILSGEIFLFLKGMMDAMSQTTQGSA